MRNTKKKWRAMKNQKYGVTLSTGARVYRVVKFEGDLEVGLRGTMRDKGCEVAVVLEICRPIGPNSSRLLVAWAQVDEWNAHMVKGEALC